MILKLSNRPKKEFLKIVSKIKMFCPKSKFLEKIDFFAKIEVFVKN